MSPSKYPQYQWLFKANSESIVSSVQQRLPRFPRRWEAGAKPNPFCSVQKRINGILYYIYCIYTCTVCIVYIYVYVTLNSFTLQWVSMVLSHVWIVELCSSAASLLNRQCSCTGTEWPSFRVPVTRSKALGVKFHQAFFFPPKWCDGSGLSSGGTKFFIGFQEKKAPGTSQWPWTVGFAKPFSNIQKNFELLKLFLFFCDESGGFDPSEFQTPGAQGYRKALAPQFAVFVGRECLQTERWCDCLALVESPHSSVALYLGNHGTIWRKLWCGW